jgi:hypothetical protein
MGRYDHVTFVYPEPDDLSVTVDWYRNKKGTDSVSGMLSVEQLPGAVPGWRAPVLHT